MKTTLKREYGSKRSMYRKILVITFLSMLLFTCVFSYHMIGRELPDEICIFEDGNIDVKTWSFVKLEKTGKAMPVNVAVEEGGTGSYRIRAKLFGMIPVKDIKVNVLKHQKVIPCGFQIGIYLQTEGVMIIDTGEVMAQDGKMYCPSENIVIPGDYVVSLNKIPVSSKSQLTYLVNRYGAKELTLGLRRNGRILHVKVKPVQSGDGKYKAGIWVRDDSQGIGTLTYVDENGTFAGLGHGISDMDTGTLLSSQNGILYDADIWGIKKGEVGNPGGLLGSITYEKKYEMGKITGNTAYGIFGVSNDKLLSVCQQEPVDIALRQEIQTGKAFVRCLIDGRIKDYEIEIEKVDAGNRNGDKGMIIHIIDEELLNRTGGIVQGQSGSPILQNGKLIGAVTHVFVDDPTRGYGIFIETMLQESENCTG